MLEATILTILFFPLFMFFISPYVDPIENLFMLQDWKVQEFPKLKLKKLSAITAYSALTIILFDLYFSNQKLNLAMFVILIIFIISWALNFRKKLLEN